MRVTGIYLPLGTNLWSMNPRENLTATFLVFTSSNFRAKYDNINVLAFQRFIMDKMNKIPHISTAIAKQLINDDLTSSQILSGQSLCL